MREAEAAASAGTPRSLSMSEAVTRDLRQAILDGSLRPGQEFMLRETARRFGVSTAPVRDAIRILQSEGLVQVRRARSAIVAPMDAADLEAIYSIRRRIEPELAARAAPKLTDEVLATLQKAAADFDAQAGAPAWDMHRDFHDALYTVSATNWEMRIVRLMAHASERYMRLAIAKLGSAAPPLSHGALIDELASRDPQRAQAALLEHLRVCQAFAAQALG